MNDTLELSDSYDAGCRMSLPERLIEAAPGLDDFSLKDPGSLYIDFDNGWTVRMKPGQSRDGEVLADIFFEVELFGRLHSLYVPRADSVAGSGIML